MKINMFKRDSAGLKRLRSFIFENESSKDRGSRFVLKLIRHQGFINAGENNEGEVCHDFNYAAQSPIRG